MHSRSAFHLDCTAVIPGCGFECAKCIQEMETTFAKMQGVSKFYMEGEGKDTKVIVEHEPNMVAVEKLLEIFKGLPSFYEGCFIPTYATLTGSDPEPSPGCHPPGNLSNFFLAL
jgi:hypothetical protein